VKIVRPFLVLSITFFLAVNLPAQIQNSGFENWSGGNPVSWYTDNLTGFYTPVTQSSTSQSGSSAVQLTIVSYSNFPVSPILISGSNSEGFPISENYGSLTGYYQFSPTTSNTYFTVIVAMKKSGNGIGGGVFRTSSSAGSYTQFTVPIYYNPGSGTADTALIQFFVYDSTFSSSSVGSSALVDDISFGPVTAVQPESNVVKDFALNQNYPNPFNPTTNISYSIPKESVVSLKVYNILGMEVATLVNRRQAAGSYNVNFNAADLPSGIYLAKLSTSGYSKTIKMSLLK
jgi:Secretion system C-terminal sorting domain